MAAPKDKRRAVAQTLGPAPAARNGREWAARERSSIGDAQRYTRFVTIMKRALPLAAGAILAAVIAYSMQPRQGEHLPMTFQSIGRINNDLAMIKPRLTGQDSEGNPYLITADEAIQDPKNVRRARLKNVEADLTLEKGNWITVTAPTGLVDGDAHKLWLNGPIALFSDDGNEFHTMTAYVDLKNGIVTGNTTVTGQGPFGTMRADRFRVTRTLAQEKPKGKHAKPVPKGKGARTSSPTRIYLYGHVHMTIYAHNKGRGK